MSDGDRRAGDSGSERELDRRRFLKSMGLFAVGGVLADLGLFDDMDSARAAGARGAAARPNIVLLLVDELRFPSVFPERIKTPGEFLRKFMPNLYKLWRHGVKFTNHHTAGNACSPARAAIVTGLYPHQEWLLARERRRDLRCRRRFRPTASCCAASATTRRTSGNGICPTRRATAAPRATYGFDGMTNPDPLGQNGEGEAKDPAIADQAVNWLQQRSRAGQPYCLTVSFVNPHDRQFFWAGTEGTHYQQLFAGQPVRSYITNYVSVAGEDAPPSSSN